MIINIAERTVFVPKTNGNDKSEKPIVFNIHFLTGEEQTEMEYYQYNFSMAKGKPESGPVKIKTDNKYVFKLGVESIENLSVGDSPITTAEQFLGIRGPTWIGRMIVEVSKYIVESMEIDEKN